MDWLEILRRIESGESDQAEVQELYNIFGAIVTEERVIQAATVDEIDVQGFRSYLAGQGLETR